ncbi:MAG: hypothetical protein SAJ12_02590 [Jaaginema sp. PMC 1079.18]|nr:hypothetical protein [Jaaginema sp. PMC 1080.18]MEC4849877.1 hypothetical protein [Jaaginema sp. PMC 1079.18]MEC4866866.1 hypothetical protein [Jaaginema sp. PMC 1078.18]
MPTPLVQTLLLERQPIYYHNWTIVTKVINGQLWLCWQHPDESFPRYNLPIGDRSLSDAVRHVCFTIDVAIKLEESQIEG